VQTLLGIPTIHGDMVNGFKVEEDASTLTLKQILTGKRIDYRGPFHSLNRHGQCSGMLVGGNLSLIAAMLGSKSALKTDGKILFLEEVGEFKYTLDRMMMSLKRSGALDNLEGLLIGGITATKADSETPFNMSVEEIILEKVADKKFPVCFNFPAGHVKNNLALKLGVHYNLYVTDAGASLSELQDPHPSIPAPIISDSLQVNK
jgi:muramoyltetrapeptide carboxypeptidase